MKENNIKKIFSRAVFLCRRHIFAIVLAFLVGGIYAAPFIYHASTPGYQGIFMADSGDADFYLTGINKSYESEGLIGDPFSYEYQNDRNPFQYFLIEFALGKIGNIFHIPIDVLAVGMTFVFPFLFIFLLYSFAYTLSESRLTAILASAAMLLGNEVVRFSSVADFLNTFVFQGSYREFLAYSRPVNPQVSGLFFFAALWCLYNLFQNPRSWRAIVLGGISTGALLYIYPYFWAFAFVVFGVMGLYVLVIRDWVRVRSIFVGGLVSIAAITPFLLASMSIFLHGSGSQLTQAVPTHRFIVEKMILAPLFLYLLVYVWAWWTGGKGKIGEWAAGFSKKYVFVFLLLIAGLIVSNQQVLTGKMVFQQHFHFFTNIPIFLLAMSILGMELLKLFLPRLGRTGVVVVAVGLLAWFSVGVQVISYTAHSAEAARHQYLAPVFGYLNTQAPPQSVVFTNFFLATRLTIYTQHFTYAGGYDATFAIPEERLAHDYFVTLALRGVTKDTARAYLYEHRNEVGGLLFIGTYWRDLCGSYGCFPDSVLEKLIPQYQDFLLQPLTRSIRTHKIDYLLWDSVSESQWKLAGLIQNPPVFESGDFKLYELQP